MCVAPSWLPAVEVATFGPIGKVRLSEGGMVQ